MFKLPSHQVAGHQGNEGKLGPLVDDSGRFYKPLQGDARGSHELAFYESFTSNTNIPDHIRRFFPTFHGTQVLQASNGSGPQPHIILDNLVFGRLNPTIMDIKIGSRTWPLKSPDEYIAKCMLNDKETTTPSLGFRVSGLQIYGNKKTGYWKPERKVVHKYSADDVRLVLRKFVSSNVSADDLSMEPDCLFASDVYGGPSGILAQLELKSWFEDQTIMHFHFHSCSFLFIFEKDLSSEEIKSNAQVKVIDFAHVVDGQGVIDHNFLGGLCSLIKFISDTLAKEEASS